MTLGEQTARGIDHPLAAIGDVTFIDQLLGAAFLAQAQGLVGDQLIGGEAVVQFDDIHVLRSQAGLLVDVLGGLLGHVIAHHLDHGVFVERGLHVGDHGLTDDVDWLVLGVLLGEFLGAHDGGAGAAGGRAALQAGDGSVVMRRFQYLFHRQRVVEDGTGIVQRMLAILHGDLGEGLVGGAVFFLVLAPGAAEKLRGGRGIGEFLGLEHHAHVLVHGVLPIGVLGAQGTLFHLLEAHGHHALGDAAFHQLLGQHQGGGAGGTVVIDVVDRNAGQAELIHGPLARGAFPVDIADHGLFDQVVGDAGVFQRLLAGRLGHHVIVGAAARFGKLGHTVADYANLASHGCLLVFDVMDEKTFRDQGAAHSPRPSPDQFSA